MTAFVNGKMRAGDPRAIALRKHEQIQLDVGSPVVGPRRISFAQL